MPTYDGFHEEDLAVWRQFKADLYGQIEKIHQHALGSAAPVSVDPRRFVFRGHGSKLRKLETSFDRRFHKKATAGLIDIDDRIRSSCSSLLTIAVIME